MSTKIATQAPAQTSQNRGSGQRGRRGNRGRGAAARGGRGGGGGKQSVHAKPAIVNEEKAIEEITNGVSNADLNAPAVAESETDETVCFICAEPIKYYSVAVCNHRTCHVCALRLRALYKKLDCTFCKVAPSFRTLYRSSSSYLLGTSSICHIHGCPRSFMVVVYS